MENVGKHLVSRIVWLVVLGGSGLVSIFEAGSAQSLAKALSGVGLGLLGLFGFLVPIPLNRPFKSMTASAQEAAVGPASLRAVLSVLALAALGLGLVLRFAVGG